MLAELPVLLVDCQATGAGPTTGHLLELAWAVAPSVDTLTEGDVHSTLVTIPRGAPIPYRVTKVTGIDYPQLRGAVPPGTVWRQLEGAVRPTRAGLGPSLAVAHFARYERGFLDGLHARFGPGGTFPLEFVCTHAIAQRLLPELPGRGLRAMAGYFGWVMPELERARPHVVATAIVWRALLERLETEHGVSTLAQLRRWLAETRPNRRAGRGFPMERARRLALPDRPGVYRMLAAGGKVLYVGKARSLHRRVNSYFQKRRSGAGRHRELLTQVRDLDLTETATPLEAALLEADEIARLDPPYNVSLRQRLDTATTWFASPDLASIRPAPDDRHCVGPWPATRHAVDTLAALCDHVEGRAPRSRAAAEALARSVVVPSRHRAGSPIFEAALVRLRRELTPGSSGALAPLLRYAAAAWRASPGLTRVERPEQWDAEQVFLALETLIARAGQLLRRAHWLCRLTDATLTWHPSGYEDGVRRLLIIDGARVVERRDLAPGEPAPTPRRARAALERRRLLDGASYARLRVLTTELRRLLDEGSPVVVGLGTRRRLDRASLARRLTWF